MLVLAMNCEFCPNLTPVAIAVWSLKTCNTNRYNNCSDIGEKF